MNRTGARQNSRRGFTLVELMVVIAILALLVSLSLPAMDKARKKALSVVCLNKLRGIGVAVNAAVQDNGNRYPKIEPDPASPIYAPEDGAKSLFDALSPYGIVTGDLKCPADVQSHNYYALKGSSFMWSPMIDDELDSNPQIYRWNNAEPVPVASSRTRIVTDFWAVHHGRFNRLYADGHVRGF